jgi:superfamily II DNA/RNA helicase
LSEKTFADFDVHPDIVASLAKHGIVAPFPIQAMTLPVALSGHDIIGQAKTGTGKTLGFGIPMLAARRRPRRQRVSTPSPPPASRRRSPSCRPASCAVQVAADLERAGADRGVRVLTVYGGRAYEPQVEALRRASTSSSARPGACIDLANQGHLNAGARPHRGARRGRRDARPGLPARRGEVAVPDSPRAGRRCSSRPPCRAPSSRWPAAI